MIYSIANDTLNAKADTYALEKEVSASSITIALDSISINGDVLTFAFKAALSAQEQTDLDALVAAHTGEKVVEPNLVELSNKTPLGLPRVAIEKPDGNSMTIVSHNFCDKNTWADPNDSSFTVEPPAGYRYKLIKAEVQFSHDVKLATLTPTAAEMHSEIYYMGVSIPEHHKIFKSLMGVFDLGNKHYTMNATVDGIPGVTTVVFDYADTIQLESAAQMKMVFSVFNNLELGGTHCTASIVATPEAY